MRQSPDVSRRPSGWRPRSSSLAARVLVRTARLSYFLRLPIEIGAPVVKRTSRRSPEPQVRVRLPAGALKEAFQSEDNFFELLGKPAWLCPDFVPAGFEAD